MATALQDLLRFLSQDAKIPLALAMGKVLELQKALLTNAEQISKTDIETLKGIFKDDKLAKQVLNAAKRVSKKRPASSDVESPVQKKSRTPKPPGKDLTPSEFESALSLPVTSAGEEDLKGTVLFTNRAPLVLAFAVCVLRYTMPEQPLSSRLSLAQAVVSSNSRTKAAHLGIEDGRPAEEEGWGEGHPTVKVLGREIHVLKRWDYDPKEGAPSNDTQWEQVAEAAHGKGTQMPPLWGVDLEAIRGKETKSKTHDGQHKSSNDLPIFRPESARSYLLKAFAKPPEEGKPPSKKKAAAAREEEKDECLARLLHAIDLVCQSWLPKLEQVELDRRAWSWYIRVRPDVQQGAHGWGEKGQVKLSDVLALRRGI
ncbi:hypothetical protein N7541_010467 [Penicillium brevicompactum]|uniref:Uncharacterized protein n=1 Tax=Penicillium brevicompactum TaxID=5074 RepID=A0A9W9UHG4_PENBR|nr:hypothetical protein N7541_010467 [Penicillium brevicompactum]